MEKNKSRVIDIQGSLSTDFLPAERASDETLLRQNKLFEDDSWFLQLVNAVPDIFLIINTERQIVFANKRMYEFLGLDSRESLLGLRPGESLNCVHAEDNAGGCGTTRFCRKCRAVSAIIDSINGNAAIEECSIEQASENALELRVWTTPIEKEGELFIIFSVQDISSEKRRRVLERIFFHDVLNTAGSLWGASNLLKGSSPDEMEELLGMISTASSILIDEIKAQKDLAAAENGDLEVQNEIIHTHDFLKKIQNIYSDHYVAEERNIKLDDAVEDVVLVSDRRLLGRVIGNLTKNALEASSPGETVTLGCKQAGGYIEFWVHNSMFMPPDIQLQLFKRSFSTKGKGRGIGTYSIQLLTQRYLNGHVSFSSDESEGTTFRVRYPAGVNSQE